MILPLLTQKEKAEVERRLNIYAVKRTIKDALVGARECHDLSNKELFKALFECVPEFMSSQYEDRRTLRGKQIAAMRNKLYKLAEEIQDFMN